VAVNDAMRSHVEEKVADVLRVFDVQPISCDVVLRVDKNPSNPDRKTCEITIFVRDSVVRVTASAADMDAAIDEAADKATRQMRKYKTKVVDKRKRAGRGLAHPELEAATPENLASLIEDEDEDDQLVREKIVDLTPMTEEEALVQTDLLGHDFFVFENAKTGLVNVIYHRHNGGYGIIKPRIESEDDE
jgi:putative sigma-54 modulation protein